LVSVEPRERVDIYRFASVTVWLVFLWRRFSQKE